MKTTPLLMFAVSLLGLIGFNMARRFSLLGIFTMTVWGSVQSGWGAEFSLEVEFNRNNRLPYLKIPPTADSNALYQLEVANALGEWSDWGRFRFHLAPYPDLQAPKFEQRFYRAKRLPEHLTNDWVNQIKSLGDQPIKTHFRVLNHNQHVFFSAKFVMLKSRPDLVYFQDKSIPFHYLFASRQFPEFSGLSPEALDDLALYPSRQQIVFGGLFFPSQTRRAYGIEFLGLEDYDPAELVELFKVVKARVALEGYEAFFVPSANQAGGVLSNLGYFEAEGVPVAHLQEFQPTEGAHSEATAIGILKYIPAAELGTALAEGELTSEIILVTDFAPRNLPPLAGLIALSPSSPNSHAVLLMESSGRPFIDLPPSALVELTNLLGEHVALTTLTKSQTPVFSSSQPHLPPSWHSELFHLVKTDALPQGALEVLKGVGSSGQVNIPPVTRLGRYVEDAVNLAPGDAKYFGGKAAHFGVLRRVIPTNSPPAIAFSFDLWLDFLEQPMPAGGTLREEINMRLSQIDGSTPAAAAAATLKQVRDLIRDAQFTSAQRGVITNALTVFDPARKIRFRSSSNAEDQPGFSGAGLYRSHSGCLLDDLLPGDADKCLCDPLDDRRRSVFLAIQRVFASLYSEEAFWERRRAGIREDEVGMALLVHHSYPDPEELANGVAISVYRAETPPGLASVKITSQRGAVPVTNPRGGELPEEYAGVWEFGFFGEITRHSSIRPPGTPVLAYPDEYDLLNSLLSQVASEYQTNVSPSVLRLNYEFKKTERGLEIKQVRPAELKRRQIDPVLLPSKTTFASYNGFLSAWGLESRHRLKSIWEVETAGATLTPNSAPVIFKTARVTFLEGEEVRTEEFEFVASHAGGLSDWPFSLYSGASRAFRNSYRSISSGRVFEIEAAYPAPVPETKPFIMLSDLVLRIEEPGQSGAAELVVKDPGWELGFTARHTFGTEMGGVEIQIDAAYGRHPNAPIDGMGGTNDLRPWHGTTLSGLTREPFVLTGFFSQTYLPWRHNIAADLLFEPGLEEELDPEILNELREANIKRIHLKWALWGSTIELIGFDGSRRRL
jgi:hypothetical protein